MISKPYVKKKRATLTAFVVGLITCTVCSANEIQTWVLEDGTEVLFLEDHRAPLVSIEINFNVSQLIPWRVKEIANAQAAFRGQLFDKNRQIRREIESSGVSISTSLGWERARIGGSSLAVDFPMLVTLIGKVLENRDYTRTELQKWYRDRVINWRSTTTNPRTILGQAAYKLLYPNENDPRNAVYDRPQSFSRSAVKLAAIRDMVLSTPTRNIAVSGSINKEELHQLIEKLLPAINESSRLRESPKPPDSKVGNEDTTIELKNLTQVYMALVRHSLLFSHDDYPAYLVVNQILGGTFNSRLYEKLRHETGDTYSATLSSVGTTTERRGMLRLQTYTRVDNAVYTERRLRSVLAELHANGVTEDEVQSALAYLRGSLVFAKETPIQIVNRAALNKVAGRDSNFRELMLERASQLTLDEINSFARRYYDPTKFALVKVVPESS
ncbi:MAG: insulinase family protein [Gammaproteobacteria bacterium]|nr:insulinase family protein [Gammaproteobacteria bacterium]